MHPTDVSLYLLTTTQEGVNGASLQRLLKSIEENGWLPPKFIHLILVQNCTSQDLPISTSQRKWLGHAGPLPLSIARNLLLDQMGALSMTANSYMLFPDDDAWYPKDFFLNLIRELDKAGMPQLMFAKYGETPAAHWPQGRIARLREVVRFASSNTIVMKTEGLRDLRGFDPSRGLGTKTSSGEDTDFALRAHKLTNRSWFIDAQVIGHRNKTRSLRARYIVGDILLLHKHLRTLPMLTFELARKYGVLTLLALRREVPFRQSIRTILRELRSSER